jgi:hypothetical protein
MTVQVWVLANPWVLHLTGVGLDVFFTCDLNPIHVETDLGVGFIFHPWVHQKPERNLKK